MTQRDKLTLAILMLAFCIVFNSRLDKDPITHILFQLPMLAASGFILIDPETIDKSRWNRGGWTTLIIAIFAIIFWMLPRNIDGAVIWAPLMLAKFISIPLLVGIPLALTWRNAHPILKAFLKAQTISMLLILSFIYTHAPIRICNVYLTSDQVSLGYGFLILATFLAVTWTAPLFILSDQELENSNYWQK